MTKSLRLANALLAALALLAAPVAGHVTTTVDPLSAPLVVGVPTDVTVHFSEPCFEMPAEVAAGHESLMAGLHADAPATVMWVGETVPFTIEECDVTAVPLALVRATATLTLTPTADAPGLTNFTLPVTSYWDGGTEPGETVDLDVTIAHYANGTLTASKADGHGMHGANGTAIELALTYVTNTPSLLTFEVTSSTGAVHEIDAVRVEPPAATNATQGEVEVDAVFAPPVEWSSAEVTFQAFLTPVVGGAKVPVGQATLTLANEDTAGHGDGHDDGHAHDDENGAPAPGFLLVALAVLVAFAARRR